MTSKEYIFCRSTEPVMAYKDGLCFEAWQTEARSKLEELLGLPLEMCEPEFKILKTVEEEGYISISFTFQSEPGYFVPCTLCVPKKLKRPLPGVICLQGHTTGAHISLGKVIYEDDSRLLAKNSDFAIQAVKEGYCAIALEQRYMGDMGRDEKDGRPACSGEFANMGSFLWGRTAIGERVWDVCRLIDVVEGYLMDYIDAKKIICMGNSGGGTATFYASCYDERIKISMPSCSVCTFEDSIMSIKHCYCNLIPGIRKYFNMGDLGGLIAPRAAVIVCGTEDKIFPLHGVEATFEVMRRIYKSIGMEEKCQLIKGKCGHQFSPQEAWPLIRKLIQEN